jgi:hypothetical protein
MLVLAMLRKGPNRFAFRGAILEHDPEKWTPVFGKDHAPSISDSANDEQSETEKPLLA